MILICSLRGHQADAAGARWNAGICFGKCVRCGSDVVRRVDGRWQVPQGYRVVWRPKPVEQRKPTSAKAADAALLDWEQPWQPAAAPIAQPKPLIEALLVEPRQAEQHELSEGTEPVAPESVAAEVTEWPLATRPADQKVEPPFPIEEPAAEALPPAAQPSREARQPSIPDFMDEEVGDSDWDDFPAYGRRSAAG